MTEEGTLSIMRRGTGYQVRYASNNPPPPETRARGRPSSSRPPRGHALRAHAREARGEAEQRLEELALLLEEAALLREEATLAMEESHQLLTSCHESR
jgi:hypothetical protein